MSEPGESTLEQLLTYGVRAYQLGEKDTGKQQTQAAVKKAVRFGLRNGYFPVVWQAYKAGRFAAEKGDK
jgi:thiamine monophosphate synthase